MGKDVLIISASPRKGGNSDTLCDQFRIGAEEAGHRVEVLRLADLRIDYCSACYACKRIGHCVKQDDMEKVIAKMREADASALFPPISFSVALSVWRSAFDPPRFGNGYPQISRKKPIIRTHPLSGKGSDYMGLKSAGDFDTIAPPMRQGVQIFLLIGAKYQGGASRAEAGLTPVWEK